MCHYETTEDNNKSIDETIKERFKKRVAK